MNKLLLVLITLISTLFFSCETDIEANAPYEDITIVYGVINPGETDHYIKISRAFSGVSSALDLAANSHNFNYAEDALEVSIEEINNGSVVKTYSTGAGTVIRTVDEIIKTPGIFDENTNVLYKFVEPAINKKSIYRIKIVNKESGKEVSSETEVVGNTRIALPSGGSSFKFYIASGSSGVFTDTPVGLTTGKSVGRAEAKLIFKYIEHYTVSSMKPSVMKIVEMSMGEDLASSTSGNESLKWKMSGNAFFDNITSAVSDPNNIPDFSHRELENISVDFIVTGSELSTFMTVSAPSNTVNQDKPNYTNIENGIGIYSSRESISFISTKPGGTINISSNTLSYLKGLGLGFCFGAVGQGSPVAPCSQL